jgi:hypothetical protein
MVDSQSFLYLICDDTKQDIAYLALVFRQLGRGLKKKHYRYLLIHYLIFNAKFSDGDVLNQYSLKKRKSIDKLNYFLSIFSFHVWR